MPKQNPTHRFPKEVEFGSAKEGIGSSEMCLWEAYRKGSDAAFVEIYEKYFDSLYAYGVRVAGDHAMVKDGIQEVFYDLKELRSKVGPTDSIKFYLFACLKRKLYRASSRWESRRLSIDTNTNFDFSLSPEQLLIDQQIGREQSEKLNRAIGQLSPRKKEIIYYFFYEGLTYEQTQEIMGLESLKATRNLLYKALNFLRDSLTSFILFLLLIIK
ncbi:RNA polymerase sigma factor [Lunatimonas salinarum]|uniref:RNA polymerase sigma factor n=1 Tax=Lunatimonas salinarum TaxID=1774590 RepID=UPI001AE00735|nr:sigma-70 family RNA polymerase sigma factor [Lunatimonas salinarum]